MKLKQEQTLSIIEDETEETVKEPKIQGRSKLQYKKNVFVLLQKNTEEGQAMMSKPFPKSKNPKTDFFTEQVKEVSMFSTVDSHKNQLNSGFIFEDQPNYFKIEPQCHQLSGPNQFKSFNEDDDYYQNSFQTKNDSQLKPNLLGIKKSKKVTTRKCHPVDDTSQYAIDVTQIPNNKTTVMIKNIPNRYKKSSHKSL